MATKITTLENTTKTDALLPRTVLKAVADKNGDFISEDVLASDINALKDGAISSLRSTYTMSNWQVGSIDTTNGADYADSNAIRYPKIGIGTGVQRMECDSNYYFLLYAWDESGNYIGAYKTDGTFNKTIANWAHLTEWDCSEYPNYLFRPVLIATGISNYTHFRFTGINGSQVAGSMNVSVTKQTVNLTVNSSNFSLGTIAELTADNSIILNITAQGYYPFSVARSSQNAWMVYCPFYPYSGNVEFMIAYINKPLKI